MSFNDESYRNAVLSRSERLRAEREGLSDNDECAFIHALPSGSVRCGALRRNHSQYTGHKFTEPQSPTPRAGESEQSKLFSRYTFAVVTGRYKILDNRSDGPARTTQIATADGEDEARLIVQALNQHATLVEQRDRLQERFDAEHELLAKVVSERNGLREQRDQLSATMINTRGILDRFLFASGPRKASRDDLLEVRREIDNVLATIEWEGEAR